MRTLGTLVVVGGTALLAYGCSAAGNAPIGDDAADGSTPPANYGGSSDASTTITDSGSTVKKDSGGGYVYDAAAPAKAAVGSACDSSLGASDPEASETCGKCGTASRVCQAPDGGTTGPGTVWAAWSACNNEKSGPTACDPSLTYTATACGNCGSMPQVCDPSACTFETGFDCTEPANACAPADTEFVLGASCPIAGQGRVYTCNTACAYATPSACQAPPPNPHTLTLSATVGGTVNGTFSLPATPQLPSFSTSGVDTCPVDVDTVDLSSGVYVAVTNPTTRTINVSLWDGPIASGSAHQYDTLMAWYNTPLFPPPDLTACGFANDDCGSASSECLNTGSFTFWSALSGSEGPSIPPGGTIQVFISMLHDDVNGSVKLYAKSEN